MCVGAVALEGPIIARDLRDITVGSKSAKLFCINFLGLCPYPDVAPWSPPGITAKPSTPRPEVSGKKPLQVVHFSDIHVDPWYTVGANHVCTKPICCRSYTTADSPGHNSNPAGPFGEHECDAPLSLEQSMYKAIRQIAPDAIFSLFTGDIVDHAIWNTTQNQNIHDINDVYGQMNSAGLKLVYGTIGNHEAHPANAFPPPSVSGASAQWVYDTISSGWFNWVGSAASSTVKQFGAYSVKYPGGNLRVISLNTNYYYVQNYWLYRKDMERDPAGQFAWLSKELAAAEKAKERVYILGHLPLGSSDAFHDGSNYFDQIVNRYSSTIAALFFGMFTSSTYPRNKRKHTQNEQRH